jgi:hypothetical protein
MESTINDGEYAVIKPVCASRKRASVKPPPYLPSSIEPLLSMSELAAILKVSRRGVERMRAGGQATQARFEGGPSTPLETAND